MKVKIHQNNLKDAVDKVSQGLNNSTMPILKGIKLTAKDIIKLRATDLEVDIEAVVEGEIPEEGEVVIPGITFKQYVSKAPNDHLEIEAENNKVTIKSNGSNTELEGWNVEEFPEKTEFDEEKSIQVSEPRLKDMLDKTSFATSEDESKPFLCGVLFANNESEKNKNELNIVATDTFKMSCIETGSELDEEFEVIIPNVTVSTLQSLLAEDEVTIYFEDNMMKFDLGDTILISRVIEGNFPNWRHVKPKNNPHKAKLDKEELKSALERVLLLAEDDVVYMDINEDRFKLMNGNNTKGQTVEKLPHDFKGDSLQISINGKYLLNFIKQSDEEVVLSGMGSMKPFKFQELDNSEWCGVIMPVRTQGGQ